MTLDTFIAIVCIIGTVVLPIVYRYLSDHVKLTYKDQKVGE